MTIYCSKKLETFLGQKSLQNETAGDSTFGDWNAHLFTIGRKKCLIFMNNRTCYSVVMTNVLKKDLKDLGQVFKERLIRQLDNDIKLNERQEIKVRNSVGDIVFAKSNNDKKIIGTINHHVENLKYNNYEGGVETWDDIRVAGILNDYLVATKIPANGQKLGDFFRPIELMENSIR